ncbi:hypothetical protein Rcae01_02113 [Novipirellula caenicola]|uniref:Transposase DDE domain-containing protein n=1 Tax=Novipirellula caenicola TaxID=1536901 RepID=A0ABP9VQS3_9BACT
MISRQRKSIEQAFRWGKIVSLRFLPRTGSFDAEMPYFQRCGTIPVQSRVRNQSGICQPDPHFCHRLSVCGKRPREPPLQGSNFGKNRASLTRPARATLDQPE